MNIGWDDESITRFVRQTLGCHCPDSVFEQIGVSELPGRMTRLDIGGRLLVYLVADLPADFGKETLEALVLAGRSDRDAGGFNRFRLVLTEGPDSDVQAALDQAFSEFADGDEKLHLHRVRADLLAGLGV